MSLSGVLAGQILGLHAANKRQRYYVTSLIGGTQV